MTVLVHYRSMHHLGLCALLMLRRSSFLAYTPTWPVALFLLLLHPPGTLYLLTFDCAKHSHFQTPLENPSIQTHLVLLCCIKRLCISDGPKGAIQIRCSDTRCSSHTHRTGPSRFLCCCSFHLELSTCWHSTVRKHSHFQPSLENLSVQTHLVLLCCIKRLCIFGGPKGAIQIRYYYYPPFAP